MKIKWSFLFVLLVTILVITAAGCKKKEEPVVPVTPSVEQEPTPSVVEVPEEPVKEEVPPAEIVEPEEPELGEQSSLVTEEAKKILEGISCRDRSITFTITNKDDMELYFSNVGVPLDAKRISIILNGVALSNIDCGGANTIAAGETLTCTKEPVANLFSDKENRLAIQTPNLRFTTTFMCK
ncbi:hypothetical protein DRJ17_03320 [Candidatus Woesearchaeota archaeon]|nr:MAG: hypothetical protein DRJ17_03320 [Candidatus Woesearchaeota archaeon]